MKRLTNTLLGALLFSSGLVATPVLFSGCSSSPSGAQLAGLRDLTTDEKGEDYDSLLNLFRDFYGPYQYKENRFQFKITDLAATLKAQAVAAKSDDEFAGYVMQFGAKLKDGHVQISIENNASGISRYAVPIIITPVEGKILIGDITAELAKSTQLSIGDEVLEIDGQPPLSYLPTIAKYKSWARDQSNQHLVVYALSRPSYMTDLKPTKEFVRLKTQNSDGDTLTVDIPWTLTPLNKDLDKIAKTAVIDYSVPFADDLNKMIDGHIGQMGNVDPFFATPEVASTYNFVKVYPSDATRKQFGLGDKDTPPIYAALYKHSGKTILLVRQATYSPTDFSTDVYMKAYMALFSEYRDLADILVLDQTHNPGGSYCADFYNLFARSTDVNGAEQPRADRLWVNNLKINWPAADPSTLGSWDTLTMEGWGVMVEKAYDQGRQLADPIPLFTGSFFTTPKPFVWSKPMFVLIDELAGSCGDIFPMLVKANHRAPMFGQTTMGLGGNVEEVGVLENSRIHVKLTRGMFYPYNPGRGPNVDEFVENNGIAPDIAYTHTVDDFRAGFVGYVKAFSDAAVASLPAPTPAPSPAPTASPAPAAATAAAIATH